MTTAAYTPRRPLAPVVALSGLLVLALVVNQWGIWQRVPPVATGSQLVMSAAATVMVALFTRGMTRVLGTVGMLGCFAGDLVPRFIEPPTTTLAMIATFAVGQLFLVSAFWRWVSWSARRTKQVGVILVAYTAALLGYLAIAPGVDRALLGPVALYGVLLVLMAVTASVNTTALLGAVCFIISDTILAIKILGVIGESLVASSLVMGLYGLALLFLAAGLVEVGQADTSPVTI